MKTLPSEIAAVPVCSLRAHRRGKLKFGALRRTEAATAAIWAIFFASAVNLLCLRATSAHR